MCALVFLDFDGVICDSALECLVSSWRAYYCRGPGPCPAAVPVALRARFLALRPFIRAGEDFLLIQEILQRGLDVRSQAQFDGLAEERGEQTMRRYAERFQAAREELLRQDHRYWVSLHRIYPHVLSGFPRWSSSPCFYILSTKKPPFIRQVLQAAGLEIADDRLLYSGKRGKGVRIAELMRRRRCSEALLVDDQIDHLLAIRREDSRVRLFLAEWGYVKREWLDDLRGMEVLPPSGLAAVVEAALASCCGQE